MSRLLVCIGHCLIWDLVIWTGTLQARRWWLISQRVRLSNFCSRIELKYYLRHHQDKHAKVHKHRISKPKHESCTEAHNNRTPRYSPAPTAAPSTTARSPSGPPIFVGFDKNVVFPSSVTVWPTVIIILLVPARRYLLAWAHCHCPSDYESD